MGSRDQVTGKKTHKNTISLPKWIHDIPKPIFQELRSDDLLSKCLHGKTQNANEALNNIIWQKCPKNVFVHRDMLEVGLNSAVVEFNDGPCGIHKVLDHFGIHPGCLTLSSSRKQTAQRVKNIQNKMSDDGKCKRKKLRTVKKGYLDKEKELEGGESYVTGGF